MWDTSTVFNQTEYPNYYKIDHCYVKLFFNKGQKKIYRQINI